jgi:hypothetical protein
MSESYSFHSLLRAVFDSDNRALKIIAESGGAGSAYSDHTIWRAVYDATNSALRVTEVGGGGASTTDARFAAYLAADREVSDEWTDIEWTSTDKNEVTHTDGTAQLTFDRDVTNCIIMVTLTADYDTADEIHYVRMVKQE